MSLIISKIKFYYQIIKSCKNRSIYVKSIKFRLMRSLNSRILFLIWLNILIFQMAFIAFINHTLHVYCMSILQKVFVYSYRGIYIRTHLITICFYNAISTQLLSAWVKQVVMVYVEILNTLILHIEYDFITFIKNARIKKTIFVS